MTRGRMAEVSFLGVQNTLAKMLCEMHSGLPLYSDIGDFLVTLETLRQFASSFLIYKKGMNCSFLWLVIPANSTWSVNAPIRKFTPTHCHAQDSLEG